MKNVVFLWYCELQAVLVHSMRGWILSSTLSCTSIMHCQLWGHATRNTSGGKSTWPLCRLYVFCLHYYHIECFVYFKCHLSTKVTIVHRCDFFPTCCWLYYSASSYAGGEWVSDSVFALGRKNWFAKYRGDCYTISHLISSDLKLISTLDRNFYCCIFSEKNDKHVFLVIVMLSTNYTLPFDTLWLFVCVGYSTTAAIANRNGLFSYYIN